MSQQYVASGAENHFERKGANTHQVGFLFARVGWRTGSAIKIWCSFGSPLADSPPPGGSQHLFLVGSRPPSRVEAPIAKMA